MAKKLRKGRLITTPLVLFIELLFPWLVFTALLVLGNAIRLNVIITVVIAMIGSLASMFLIRWERSLRRIRQLREVSERDT